MRVGVEGRTQDDRRRAAEEGVPLPRARRLEGLRVEHGQARPPRRRHGRRARSRRTRARSQSRRQDGHLPAIHKHAHAPRREDEEGVALIAAPCSISVSCAARGPPPQRGRTAGAGPLRSLGTQELTVKCRRRGVDRAARPSRRRRRGAGVRYIGGGPSWRRGSRRAHHFAREMKRASPNIALPFLVRSKAHRLLAPSVLRPPRRPRPRVVAAASLN